MELWPNFFIVGAPKAGTTTLYEYLKKIPRIYMSEIKEPFYFSIKTVPDVDPFKPIRNKKNYLDLFKNVTNEKIIGEASTLYLSDPDALKLIHQVSPKARIIISLRDPVERIYSHYFMIKNFKWIKSSFHKQLQKELMGKVDVKKPYLRLYAGLYYEDLQRCFDTFGKKNTKVIIFEEFIKNPKNILEDILDFLKINYHIKNFQKEAHGRYFKIKPRNALSKYMLQSDTIQKTASFLIPSLGRQFIKNKIFSEINFKKPEMEYKDKQQLIKYYSEDVKKLQTLLGRKLPWSNFF